MSYKISGTKSETSRVMVLKESDWSIESNTVVSGSGSYEIDGLVTGNKLVFSRANDGEVIGYGNVVGIESAVDYTQLLLHLDNNLTDSSQTGITPTSDITFSSGTKKFGTHSGYMTGEYIAVPNHSNFDFGTGDFTVDFWVYVMSYEQRVLFGWYTDSGGEIALQHSTNNDFMYMYANNTSDTIFGGVFPTVTWVHYAYVRDGSNAKIFQNGVLLHTEPMVAGSCSPSGDINLGWTNSTFSINGYMDEFRISNTARWTTDFSLPTEPY